MWSSPQCRKHRKPGIKPKTGGLWAKSVGDIVAADAFYFRHRQPNPLVKGDKGGKLYAIVHIVDLFSGYSVCYVCPGNEAKAEDEG